MQIDLFPEAETVDVSPADAKLLVSSRFNHFQFHGSIIYDERRKIIEAARFDDYKIVKHERYIDGSFVSENFKMTFTFLHNGQLYCFLTTHHGAISDFFELNMSKEKCLNGQYGVYYEAVSNGC